MRGFLWLVAGIVALAVVAMAVGPKQDRECDSKASAYAYAKTVIEDRLRSPSTAEWPSMNSAYAGQFGECGYRFSGELDSQNGFGATVRSRFTAEVFYIKKDSRWSFKSAEVITR